MLQKIQHQKTENEATNTTTEGSSDTTKTEKKITMKIDDQEIMSTSFDEPITTGKIQLSVGECNNRQEQHYKTMLTKHKVLQQH